MLHPTLGLLSLCLAVADTREWSGADSVRVCACALETEARGWDPRPLFSKSGQQQVSEQMEGLAPEGTGSQWAASWRVRRHREHGAWVPVGVLVSAGRGGGHRIDSEGKGWRGDSAEGQTPGSVVGNLQSPPHTSAGVLSLPRLRHRRAGCWKGAASHTSSAAPRTLRVCRRSDLLIDTDRHSPCAGPPSRRVSPFPSSLPPSLAGP